MSEEIEEYDKNNNLIHWKDSNGYESWNEYDENNNLIYYKGSDGFESWREYDENNHCIHWKTSKDYEIWWKWENKLKIEITKQEFKQIERTKLRLNIKNSNRFELMDI